MNFGIQYDFASSALLFSTKESFSKFNFPSKILSSKTEKEKEN